MSAGIRELRMQSESTVFDFPDPTYVHKRGHITDTNDPIQVSQVFF